MLSTHLCPGLSCGLFPAGFSVHRSPSIRVTSPPRHIILMWSHVQYSERRRDHERPHCGILSSLLSSLFLAQNIFLQFQLRWSYCTVLCQGSQDGNLNLPRINSPTCSVVAKRQPTTFCCWKYVTGSYTVNNPVDPMFIGPCIILIVEQR